MTKDNKVIKLTSAYFYDSEREPSVINLLDSTVAVNVPGFISGYHGSLSKTKGFKPVKEIADNLKKKYTIIDFVVSVNDYIDSDAVIPDGMLLTLRQLTKAQQARLYDEIRMVDPTAVDKILAHSGLHRALMDDPTLLTRLKPLLGRFHNSVIIHTICPHASPSLVVASFDTACIKNFVVAASCRFNQDCKVIW